MATELELGVMTAIDPDDGDVDRMLEVGDNGVALAETAGTLVDSRNGAVVCGRSSPQSQGSVP